jgi:hypothetical protein
MVHARLSAWLCLELGSPFAIKHEGIDGLYVEQDGAKGIAVEHVGLDAVEKGLGALGTENLWEPRDESDRPLCRRNGQLSNSVIMN